MRFDRARGRSHRRVQCNDGARKAVDGEAEGLARCSMMNAIARDDRSRGAWMKRVLITGMSGTGKSSVILELAARGYRAYDLDTPEWSQWVDAAASDTLTPAEGKDWVWREDRVRELLSKPGDGTLFVGGCAENMKRLFPLIDTMILLSAPVETIMLRLAARSRGGYGNTADEWRKVSELIRTIEPLLRESAHHEIDTRGPVAATVDEILRVA
jgi:shikimate kinase